MKFYEFSQKSDQLTTKKKKKIETFVLDQALGYMIKEYEFWMGYKSVEIENEGVVYKLNVYRANTNSPRPESYSEDTNLGKQLKNDKDRAKLYMDIATAAESGFDFSSRWLNDPMDLKTIQTTDIVPVDLNAILYKTEVIISQLCAKNNDLIRSKIFKKYSVRRKSVINRFLWSDTKMSWGDLNLKTKKVTSDFYITDLSPLWHGITPPVNYRNILNAYSFLFDKYQGGIPVSIINSGQQWDYPNTWAPYQQSLVDFLIKNDRQLALKIARKFFKSVHEGWLKTGLIYEKYDASLPGLRGTGGEYLVQSGFGWTNGCALYFLFLFKDEIIFEDK